jgi:uncharacterized protein (UPF0212 family)
MITFTLSIIALLMFIFLTRRVCPHCREYIWSTAVACPHCGRDVPRVRVALRTVTIFAMIGIVVFSAIS